MKEKGVKSSMKFPQKQVLSSPLVAEEMSQQVESLHQKETVRLSLDVSYQMYIDLKAHHFKKGYRTTRAYLVDLLAKDLGISQK